jgi:hypothetical protein
MASEADLLDARPHRLGFGVANVAIGALLAVGVFRWLPARWWVVDGGAALVASLLVASGAALLARHRLAVRLTRIAAAVSLVLGLALFAALAFTAAWIGGLYGPVGTSGAIVFGLVAVLVLPYLVILPAAELVWVGAPRPSK